MNTTLKYGLISGLIIAIGQLIAHYANFELSQGGLIGFGFPLVVSIIAMVMGVKQETKNQEGFISFGEALKTAFLIFLIAVLVVNVISFIQMKTWSDETWQELSDISKANAIASAEYVTDLLGVEMPEEAEEQMEEELEKLDVEYLKESTTSIGSILFVIFILSIAGLIISLIISAIMKKDPMP